MTASDRADAHVVSKDMGVTHAECRRTLAAVVPDVELNWRGDTATATWPDRRLEIRLGPEQTRRIASLSLPRTEVSLVFTGFTADQRQALLRNFDLRFQRGGG
ncbi:hypothetical protein J2T57_002549 [Natronocella acetinitrilica]|jgi:hypothetical protein|uniref:Uncharacterized protein n=1 Tax=Natronocella acetinitrilica TaxID=414046 RepID=A0AAE3G4C6_9GAMM|nr:hypothetical protein [Natronocella acetinitrilica]MCP1675399.1 hypothetical protein [Natronocella acetinitrilica]